MTPEGWAAQGVQFGGGMSEARHEHTFVWDGEELLPCVCGADMMAIESVLTAAADDSRRVAGEGHYTGCRLRQESETVELWMCDAPSRILRALEAMHHGVYLIHNDAPRPYTTVLELMDALPVDRLKAEGIHIVRVGPTHDGYLHVSVMGDVPTAQARLDAMYAEDVAQVTYGEPAIAC
jgi:hypothetical protein